MLYGPTVRECAALFRVHTDAALRTMWVKLRPLYEQLKDKASQLSIVILTKVSEALAERRGFALAVPGGEHGQLESIEHVLEILGTQQHPRCTYLISATGARVKFLLKGNEDLRLDERLMRFFALANVTLRRAKLVAPFVIACYTILPLTRDAGLIKWVTGADTMHQMVVEDRRVRGVSMTQETEICRELCDCEFRSLNALQRLELFQEVAAVAPARELFEYMWLKAPNAAAWVARTEQFTLSSALMSIVGYVIGLGDRHPSNIRVVKESGNVVHIDFGESFDSAKMRAVNAERVPFRLTRMIVNALEGSVSDGKYFTRCIAVMQIMRKHRVMLATQITLFLREQLQIAATKLESHVAVLEKVLRKLDGTAETNGGEEIEVEKLVGLLIQTAENPQNYVRHYPGWCPFW
jgi:phosphatidylinositol kinase/protein kinase (PI-3  family)